MAKAESLKEVLVEDLKDLLDAEEQLVKTLPKLAEEASSQQLETAFREHLRQTEGHVKRLRQAFEQLDEQAKSKTCDGMRGLIQEGEKHLKTTDDPSIKDVILIGAAQKAEHYEMAAYGSAKAYAELLGHQDVVSLLDQTLEEEKEADQKLSEIAESEVNPRASGGEATTAAEVEGTTGRSGQSRGIAASGMRGMTKGGVQMGRRAGHAVGLSSERASASRGGSNRRTSSSRKGRSMGSETAGSKNRNRSHGGRKKR